MKSTCLPRPLIPAWTSPRRAAERPSARGRSVRLDRDEVLRLTGGQCLEVKSGVLWLTGTPAQGDILLSAGERFELRGGSSFVAQALEDAEFFLAPLPRPSARNLSLLCRGFLL